MSLNNYWCPNHKDANGTHRDCNLCNNKGDCQSSVENLACPVTQQFLKKMGEVVVGGYTKFSSLPTSEKSKLLKQRSHKHFKQHIEEKKVAMNRKINPNYEPKK